ncbi:MAG: hypothetical protein E4H24_07460 [Thermomicrobiales bacterium]|nr:MAG: hypothetical protein E4H24_07460 [Thermomicrobiales bacterium]
MTTGQCFLSEADGTYPTWGTAWGSLDGNDDLRFSAKLGQDGTFGSEVTGPGDSSLFWIAGERSPEVHDLVVELDIDAQTIKGSGTFYSLTTNKLASGSFEFICEPAAQ